MDEIIIRRLKTFASNIENLVSSAKKLYTCRPWDTVMLEQSTVTSSKLQSMLTRFNADLYQYFNIATCPDADEVSNLTTSQVEGEEALAELKARIENMKESKPSEPSSTMNRSKLPELTLPKFKGDILGWYPFWDQFNSNIGQRNLSNVDKLLYLKTSLEGEARTMVDGLETTNDNYQIAVETLKGRYGRREQVIDAHYSTLSKIKPVDKFEDCRKTYDEIERHLRVLQSLGENVNQNHLRFLLMEKFPEDITYEVRLKAGTESIERIRKELNVIISAREDAKGFHNKNKNEEMKYTTEALHTKDIRRNKLFTKPKPKFNKNVKYPHRIIPSTTAFAGVSKKRPFELKSEEAVKNNPQKRTRYLSCIFCQSDHYNDQCTTYKTLSERKKRLQNRCYQCLQQGHRAKFCTKTTVCHWCQKRGEHNRALCPQKFNVVQEMKPVKTLQAIGKSSIILQTAVVNVTGPDEKSMRYRLLFDSGSQRSYITKGAAEELHLEVEEENRLLVFTFGAKKPQEINSQLVKIHVETKTDKAKPLFVNVVPSITHSVSCPGQELTKWVCDKNIVLADDGSLSDQVDILIGNDYYYTLMLPDKVKLQEDLYLIDSEFGWIFSGRTKHVCEDELQVLTYFQSSYETKLNDPDLPIDKGSVKNLWELESIGITDSPKIDRDEEAVRHFNETTTIEDNRYYVSWPWTEYPPDLPTNFGMAYGRLIGLLKRLDRDTLMVYDQTLRSQLDKGIIELVPNQDKVDHPIHYLAHHGVSAPGKILRIVYDASAKTSNKKSLNECLYCGPILIEDLTGLLIKFRGYKVGITADVEKAFLQMALYTKDRDVTRFLWLRDINKPATEDNILHYRFTRVPFGIISSPFLLNATIKHHLSSSDSERVKSLINSIYVDNLVTGANSVQEAIVLCDESKTAFQQISMNLREWTSNSEEFMRYISEVNEEDIVKTLGLDWNLKRDTLQLRIKNLDSACTKRGILKTIASIYDPCGFAAPLILPGKLLLQSLWQQKYQWDTPLPEEIINKWKTILKDLELAKDICLPRNISQHTSCQLHCFTDSSTKAYAAVVYLVQRDNVKYVIGKTRLAPIKDQENMKIPRLELLSVLIGSRLLQYAMKYITVNVEQQILWTDSQIVISWYHSNKLLTPFVARRIEEIKRNQSLVIKHVLSELNSADVATRPIKSKADLERWLCGPTFLMLDSENWPRNLTSSTSCVAREDLLPNDGILQSSPHSEEELNDSIRSSKGVEKQEDLKQVHLQGEDLTRSNKSKKIRSETQELVELQSFHFPEEMRNKETNLSRNLGLFRDVDNVLRCGGRLTNSDLSYDAKHPILLPRDSDFTNKIIKNIHEDNYHVGVPHTLSLIRQKYWIPQGRTQIQKLINKCPQCKKHGGGPYTLPSTPALPPERVKYETPFAYVGMDYFGPMLVKTENGKEKRWICLFTCLVIRAIHLEIVKDMTAEECSFAVRRFIAAKGVPDLIVSDNAMQFRLLSEILSAKGLEEKEIKWKFIPQLAPWHGGVYERLVAIVKHCLKRTLQKHLLGDNQLQTIIKEVESVVNTRPLTYVSGDLEHILKPADFLTPGRCINPQSIMEKITSSTTSTKQQLIEAWKRGETILDEYRNMFINQYLLSLRERYRHSPKQPRVKAHDMPRVGDIVQIKGENKNRNNWKVGRISELLFGNDGLCRVAKVKVGDTMFTRSISHLYPLETDDIQVTEDNDCLKIDELCEVSESPEVNLPRPIENLSHLPNDDVMDSSNLDVAKETEVTERSHEDIDMDIPEENDGMKDTGEEMDIDDNNLNSLPNEEGRGKRVAAVQTMEKIKEWTRHLMTTLFIQC